MSEQPEIITHLKNALLQQRLNLKTMLTVLDAELLAVQKRKGDDLLAVSKQKEQLLSDINDIDKQCNTEQFKPYLSEHNELIELRNDVTAALHECQQKNEVIYLAATQTQVAVEEVKRLLIGGSKNATYDSYGQKNTGGSLGKGIKA